MEGTLSISALVVADSISPAGVRITTMQLRYPRFIHAELMTHRVFSRNASSSRAVPVKRVIEALKEDTAMPLHWGKNQTGMQAREEWNAPVHLPGGWTATSTAAWNVARDRAIEVAEAFDAAGYHKQIVNRLLEPFSHINVLVTSTYWANWDALRAHPDAQPEIQMLAQAMIQARAKSKPKLLHPGEWHLPYVSEEDRHRALSRVMFASIGYDEEVLDELRGCLTFRPSLIELRKAEELMIKLSIARCASVSYKTVDGQEMTFDRAIALSDKLLASAPLHASPAEHQATPDDITWWGRLLNRVFDTDAFWSGRKQWGNFHGWCQYRKTLAGEFVSEFA